MPKPLPHAAASFLKAAQASPEGNTTAVCTMGSSEGGRPFFLFLVNGLPSGCGIDIVYDAIDFSTINLICLAINLVAVA